MKSFAEKDLKEIHVIPYCHTDYAWTHPRTFHISRYIECYRRILDLMEEHEDYTAVLDNVVHSLIPFLRYCPERAEQLKKFVRAGRWDVSSGGWSLVRPGTALEETFVRNLEAADREFRRLFGEDLPIETYFNADTAMGHTQLPQLVRLMGYRYYQFQRPNDWLNRKGVPKQFRWRGLDGSEITVARGFYCGFADAWYAKPEIGGDWQSRKAGLRQDELNDRLKNQQFPEIQIFQGVDDMLPNTNRLDEPIDLWGFIRDWNEHEESRMRFSTVTDFMHCAEKYPLEVLEGRIEPHDVTYNIPAKGQGGLRWLRQEMDKLLTVLETVYALLEANGGKAFSWEEMDKKWKSCLEITGHAMDSIFAEDWDRVYDAALGAYYSLKEEVQTAKEALADLVGCGTEDETVVLNPNGFAVTQTVLMNVACPKGLLQFDIEDEAGNPVPWQYAEISNGDKAYTLFNYSAARVEAKVTVPAYGVKVLKVLWGTSVVPWFAPEEKCVLQNPLDARRIGAMDHVMRADGYSAVFRGGILMGFGKTGAAEPVSPVSFRFVKTEARNDWLFSLEPLAEYVFAPEKAEIIMNGPLVSVYKVTGSMGNASASVTYTLGRIPGLLGAELTVSRTGENGYFTADFACDEGTSLGLDMPFGWENTDAKALWDEEIPAEEYEITLRGQFAAKSWAMFRRGGVSAAAVCPENLNYWQYDGEKNRVSILLGKQEGAAAEPFGRLDAWKYRASKGVERVSDTFTVVLAAEPESEAALSCLALACRKPLETAQSWSGIKKAPAEAPFAAVNGAEICTTALYRQDDAWVCRFWECGGKDSVLTAKVPKDVKTAVKTDLRGRIMEKCPVKDGIVSVKLRKFEIVTLKFQ